MSGALLDPLSVLGEMLLHTDIESLKNLCQVTPPLHRFFIHKIYPNVHLRNEVRCLEAFLSFAELGLGFPLKFRKLRLSISDGDTSKLEAALKLFLNSDALQVVEFKGAAGIDYSTNLLTLIGRIAATATSPLTMVYENIRFIPCEFILYARHVELKLSNLDPFGTYPPIIEEWPLQTLSFSRDAGKPTFDAMFIRGIKLPNLTHLLINIKPSASDIEYIDESLLTILQNSQSFEELVLIYEPNSELDFSLIAYSLDALAKSLSSFSACRPHSVRLHIVLRCSAYHAFQVLDCMKALKDFSE
ncbi:hypothetical protein CVT26_008836, partial [Gymnopilus dilepis]